MEEKSIAELYSIFLHFFKVTLREIGRPVVFSLIGRLCDLPKVMQLLKDCKN